MQPKLRVVPGRHHDPAEEWHRPPKLRAVMELGPRPLSRRQAERWLERLGLLGIGFALGVVTLAVMIGRV